LTTRSPVPHASVGTGDKDHPKGRADNGTKTKEKENERGNGRHIPSNDTGGEEPRGQGRVHSTGG